MDALLMIDICGTEDLGSDQTESRNGEKDKVMAETEPRGEVLMGR